MALYSWGGGGKDEEWLIISELFFHLLNLFSLLRVTWREFSPGVRKKHVD